MEALGSPQKSECARRPRRPAGEFTLRPEDWELSLSLLTSSLLSLNHIILYMNIRTMNIAAKKLKVPKEETTVEAVVHMNKDQEAVTASLVRGAGRPGSCPHLAGRLAQGD